jgi:hypothetical protein
MIRLYQDLSAQLLDINRIDDNQSNKDIRNSGLLLLFLIGIVSPLALLFIDDNSLVGPIPTLIILLCMGIIYATYIFYTGRLTAGLLGSLPVLLLFDISFPLSPAIETRQIRFILAGCGSIPLSMLVLYRSELRLNTKKDKLTLMLLIFSIFSIISGIINTIKGNPITGVVFGINTLNIVFICFSISGSIHRFNPKALVDLLLYSTCVQIIWAILQAVIGSSLGLRYLGDSNVGRIYTKQIQLLIFEVPIGALSAGRFAGGLAGTSRVLAGILVILLPISIYRLRTAKTQILVSLFIFASSILLVILAHSDAALGTVTLGIILAAYVNSRITIKNIRLPVFYFVSSVVTVIVVLMTWTVLKTGQISGSTPRVKQILTAQKTWMENVLFGIGGYNSRIILGLDVNIHNFIISFFTELGIFATLVYLFSILICFTTFSYSYFHNGKMGSRVEGTMISTLIIFHLYISLTTVYLSWNVMALFWMLMIIGLHYTESNEKVI